MALTVTSPPTGRRIGPGAEIQVHSSLVGPIASDDYYLVRVFNTSTFPYTDLVYGTRKANGSHDATVLLGINEFIGYGFAALWGGCADGGTVGLHLELLHSNGVTVESADPSSWSWDAASNLWRLVGVPAITGDSAKIDQILSAVYRPFPA